MHPVATNAAAMFHSALLVLPLLATPSSAVRPEFQPEPGTLTLQLHPSGHAQASAHSAGHRPTERPTVSAQLLEIAAVQRKQNVEAASSKIEKAAETAAAAAAEAAAEVKGRQHVKVHREVRSCGALSKMTRLAGTSLLQFFGRSPTSQPALQGLAKLTPGVNKAEGRADKLYEQMVVKDEVEVNGVPYVPEKNCEGVTDVFRHLVSQERQAEVFLMLGSGFATIFAVICISVIIGMSVKHSPPLYWKNRGMRCCCTFNDGYYDEVDVTEELLPVVQRLMDMTTVPSKMGVGRDGSWQTHKAFKVTKVLRIEHGKQWTHFAEARRATHTFLDRLQAMSDERRQKTEADIETVQRCFAAQEEDPVIGEFLQSLEMDSSRNEVLLFHGSPLAGGRNSKGEVIFPTETNAPMHAIKMTGFDERLSNVKGMLGAGTYFGDHASKADCYAGRYHEWKDGVDPGSTGEQAAMFLVRVVLGCPYVTNQSLEQLRRPPCIHGHFDAQLDFSQVSYGTPWHDKGFKLEVCDHPRYDSVISDMFIDGDEKNYREFVLYEKRAYPEFLVYYDRVASPDEA